MKKQEVIHIVSTKDVETRVIELRGKKILLDSDVADLYGVETKRVNEAVRRNLEKFPERYSFTLQVSEKQEVVANCDRFKNLKNSAVEPRAFTEGGLYMLATILKSPKATETTIAIIDTFTKLREVVRNIEAIHNEADSRKQKGLIQRTGELLSMFIII